MKRPSTDLVTRAAAAWLVLVFFFWPGLMAPEFAGASTRCARGLFEELSPVGCGGWRALELLGRGGALLFLLQVTALVAGVLQLGRLAAAHGRWGAAAFLVFALPAVTAGISWVSEDVLMVACLVLGVGLLLAGATRMHRAAALALFFAASCAHHDAIVSIVPLMAWALAQRTWWRTALVTLAATALFLAGQWALGSSQRDSPSAGASPSVRQQDLLAIAFFTGENLVPPSSIAPASVDRLLPYFDPRSPDGSGIQAEELGLEPSHDAEVLKEQRRAWLGAIVKHPATYLLHRAQVFAEFLRHDEFADPGAAPASLSPARPRLKPAGTGAPRWTASAWLTNARAQARWLFAPTPWLAASLALAAVAAVRRRRLEATLLASSFLHALLLFFFAGTGHSFYWNVWCLVLALLVEWTGVERPAAPEPGSSSRGTFTARAVLVVACLWVVAAVLARPSLVPGDLRIRLATPFPGRTELMVDGVTPPEGSAWNGPEAFPVSWAATRLDFVLPGAPLHALELQLAGEGSWRVSASTDGAAFDPLGELRRVETEGLRTTRLEVANRPYRLLRLEAREGGQHFSVGEVRPLTSSSPGRDVVVDFGWGHSRRWMRHGWDVDSLDGLQPFVWALGTHACLEVPRPTPATGVVTMRLAPFRQEGIRQQVVVHVNGLEAGTLTLEPGVHDYQLAIPAGAARPQTRLDFDMDWAADPAPRRSADQRRRSVRFEQVALAPP